MGVVEGHARIPAQAGLRLAFEIYRYYARPWWPARRAIERPSKRDQANGRNQ
jgi:hypothetical protein